jgi:hypothetical protein
MHGSTRWIVRADAVFDFAFGLLLLLSPWIRPVFEVLDLPNPQPEVFTRFCGGLLVVCAYLLWLSPGSRALAGPVCLSIGFVNAVGVLPLIGWMLSGALGVGPLGTVILSLACVALILFAVGELWHAVRP